MDRMWMWVDNRFCNRIAQPVWARRYPRYVKDSLRNLKIHVLKQVSWMRFNLGRKRGEKTRQVFLIGPSQTELLLFAVCEQIVRKWQIGSVNLTLSSIN